DGSSLAALPAHVVAAVDVEVGAGDPARLLVGEEAHAVGDFLRRAEAAGGDVGDDLGADFLRHRHHHVGGDVARGNRVHGDAVARVLARQGNGEAVHAGLGRGVVGLAVLALQAVDRADLDDPAPFALAHALDHRAGDVEAGIEVGVDHVRPL